MTTTVSATAPSRRPYDSTLRRERAAETRDRIVAAGCRLLQDVSIRDWRGVTMRTVAERAGVNERTVYRHFTNERGLRDAVMRRLEQQAGIDLDELRLEDVPDVAARIIGTIASHPLEPRPELDATLTEAGQREREALRRAVGEAARGWTDDERRVAAGMLDVLLAVATYERLAGDWELDAEQAIAGVTWVAGLIGAAVREDRGPIA
jgi:AcrR family transcriptional regulator